MSAVTFEGLRKAFGTHVVLDGLDLEVPDGSLTAVLGASGSGKTTLLRILAGFEPADSGTVSIGERVVDSGDGRRHVSPKDRRVGFVAQEGSLFPHLTVAQNVGFGLRRGQGRAGRVAEMLEVVGLADLGHRYPHQLSGGEQQRVALARALAVAPSLVLLDEPFASLDAGLRASLRAEVRSILQKTATTALLVTHDQDEALSWADVVAVIRGGRIAQQTAPRLIYGRPRDADVAAFVGVANLVDGTGTDSGDCVLTAFGPLPLLAGTPPLSSVPAVVLLRPEQISVRPHEDGSTGLNGRVADVQFYGHDVVVTVAPDRPCGADRLVARADAAFAADLGAAVSLSVSEPVHAWPRQLAG